MGSNVSRCQNCNRINGFSNNESNVVSNFSVDESLKQIVNRKTHNKHDEKSNPRKNNVQIQQKDSVGEQKVSAIKLTNREIKYTLYRRLFFISLIAGFFTIIDFSILNLVIEKNTFCTMCKYQDGDDIFAWYQIFNPIYIILLNICILLYILKIREVNQFIKGSSSYHNWNIALGFSVINIPFTIISSMIGPGYTIMVILGIVAFFGLLIFLDGGSGKGNYNQHSVYYNNQTGEVEHVFHKGDVNNPHLVKSNIPNSGNREHMFKIK